MQKPKALRRGDTLGVVAPSGSASHPEKIDQALDYLRDCGFHIKEGRHIRRVYGYLAGSDEERVEDIHRLFRDDTVDGIICLKGGYGTPRIAPKIDLELIRSNPKVFIGYSDITTLHLQLGQAGDLVTFHGPMPVSDMLDGFSEFSDQSLWRAVSSRQPLGEIQNPPGEGLVCLSPGRVSGPIVGGNLTLLALSIGTPYELDTRGKILFIEDTGEEPYRVDGYLCQLRNAGKFQECLGFLIGDFKDAQPRTNPSLNLWDVFRDLLVSTGKPVLANLRAGHCNPTLTLPLGVSVTLDAEEARVVFQESACV